MAWKSKTGKDHGNKKHGYFGSRVYRIWGLMLQRTTNPKNPAYPAYGGAGIGVCEDWRDFLQFLADMGEPPALHTLERKNNFEGYSLDNCVWATPAEQARNRHFCIRLTDGKETKTLSEWAKERGLSKSTVHRHFHKGQLPEGLSIID